MVLGSTVMEIDPNQHGNCRALLDAPPFDWSLRWAARKASRSESSDDGESDDASSSFSWQRSLVAQLSQYVHHLFASGSDTTTDNSLDRDENNPHYRRLIRDTRLALRYACLSIARAPQDEEEVVEKEDDHGRYQRCRSSLQSSCLQGHYRCDAFLRRILAAPTDGGGNDDAKCRVLAGRLWCNLLTGHLNNCQWVAASVPLSPSPNDRRRHQLHHILKKEEGGAQDEWASLARPSTWWDFVHQSAANREALAAVLAALYNTVVVGVQLSSGPEPSEAEEEDNPTALYNLDRRIATDSLLLCALLRLVVAPQAVIMRRTVGPEGEGQPGGENDDNEDNLRDEATNWILLLLEKLVRRGHLPAMYSAIAGAPYDPTAQSPSAAAAALPEHVVLLFCVQVTAAPSNPSERPGRLCDSWADARRSLAFLAQIYADLNSAAAEQRRMTALGARRALPSRGWNDTPSVYASKSFKTKDRTYIPCGWHWGLRP